MHSLPKKVIKWAILYGHCGIPIGSWYAIPFFEPNFTKMIIHLQETKFTVKSLHVLIIPSSGTVSIVKQPN
jgi:hypothetical protein